MAVSQGEISQLKMLQEPEKRNHLKNVINIVLLYQNSIRLVYAALTTNYDIQKTVPVLKNTELEKPTEKLDKNPTKSVDVCLCVSL